MSEQFHLAPGLLTVRARGRPNVSNHDTLGRRPCDASGRTMWRSDLLRVPQSATIVIPTKQRHRKPPEVRLMQPSVPHRGGAVASPHPAALQPWLAGHLDGVEPVARSTCRRILRVRRVPCRIRRTEANHARGAMRATVTAATAHRTVSRSRRRHLRDVPRQTSGLAPCRSTSPLSMTGDPQLSASNQKPTLSAHCTGLQQPNPPSSSSRVPWHRSFRRSTAKRISGGIGKRRTLASPPPEDRLTSQPRRSRHDACISPALRGTISLQMQWPSSRRPAIGTRSPQRGREATQGKPRAFGLAAMRDVDLDDCARTQLEAATPATTCFTRRLTSSTGG